MKNTKKTIIFISIITLIVMMAGGYWLWQKVQQKQHEMSMIGAYCQNATAENKLSEYSPNNKKSGHDIIAEYPKFDSLTLSSHNADIANIELSVLCKNHASAVRSANNTAIQVIQNVELWWDNTFFWYELNDKYIIMGRIYRREPMSLADDVMFFVIRNNSQTVAMEYGFVADNSMSRGGYKKLTYKDIKEIINIILRDNATDILQ